MKKSCRKCASKASPRLLLLNNPKQPLYGRNFFKNNILKEDYQKALKKLTLFFLLNPVLFNGQSYQNKKGLELVTSSSSSHEASSEKFLYLLYII